MSDCVKGFGCRPLKDRGHKQGGRRPKIFKGDANKLPTAILSSHVLSQWPKGKWTRKQNLQSHEALGLFAICAARQLRATCDGCVHTTVSNRDYSVSILFRG